jgi:hypothetical protein
MGEQQALDFADAQDRKWQHWRLLISELKAARYLRLSIGIYKQRIVDSYFQAVRGKKPLCCCTVMASISTAGEGEEGDVPTVRSRQAAKRRFRATGACMHRTSRVCPQCQQNDLAPATAEGQQRPEQTSLHYRSCPCCSSAEPAGSSDTDQQALEKEHGVCVDLRRGTTAEIEATRRPQDLRSRACYSGRRANRKAHHAAPPPRFAEPGRYRESQRHASCASAPRAQSNRCSHGGAGGGAPGAGVPASRGVCA